MIIVIHFYNKNGNKNGNKYKIKPVKMSNNKMK